MSRSQRLGCLGAIAASLLIWAAILWMGAQVYHVPV